MKKDNLRLKRFGRLTALFEASPHVTSGGNKQIRWLCICDCGQELAIKAGHLRTGNTRSCGCLGPESSAKVCVNISTHGMRHHWLYKSWQGLLNRCLNPSDPAYDRYGGRGIFPCAGIKESPANLLAILGERPPGNYPSGRPEWTIDRENNDGGYWCGVCQECLASERKTNIRWATSLQQNQNSRMAVNITINGITKCASEWARSAGTTVGTITNRLKKGWIGDKLISPPRIWKTIS
jgi:hypothetical protein